MTNEDKMHHRFIFHVFPLNEYIDVELLFN